MAASPHAPEPRRATALLSGACDNRCRFCARVGAAPELSDEAAIEARLLRARGGAEEVTLVGGEPGLLGDRLALWVARARALGFGAVGVQSHGRGLDAALLDALVAAGLSDLHLSIHGESEAVHDFHTGIAGSFAAAMAALTAARQRGVTVVVTTVLTRSNMRSLGGLAAPLKAGGAAAWTIAAPAAAGQALLSFESVMPRLGLALPYALQALVRARSLGLWSFIADAPLCALGPHRGLALRTAARAFVATCDGCAARGECAGLDAVYAARFGGDEVAAARLQSAPSVDPAAARALRRLFVGAGALTTELRSPASVVAPARGGANLSEGAGR
ncbi:MAG: radical SAM protein [Nannocystis sp.]|nr:radical SAM protein [Nannocystis sp.]